MKVFILVSLLNNPREKVDLAQATMSRCGHQVIGNSYDYLRSNNVDDGINQLYESVAQADAIYLCKGWNNSHPCRLIFKYCITHPTHAGKKFRVFEEQ